MENNCVVLREFEVPGGTYYPGRELCLDAVLLEKWTLGRLVGPIQEEVKPKKKRKRRTVKVKTVVTA